MQQIKVKIKIEIFVTCEYNRINLGINDECPSAYPCRANNNFVTLIELVQN